MHRLVAFVLLVLSAVAQAETINPRIYKNDVCGFRAVLHINGVDTSREGALLNTVAIEGAYGNAHDGYQLRYGLAYNPTLTQKIDIVQAAKQSLQSFPGIKFKDWIRAVYRGLFSEWLPAASSITELMAFLGDQFNLNRPDTDYDVDALAIHGEVVQIGFVTSSSHLLIVGHSQGSILANILFDRLTSSGTWGPQAMQSNQVGLMSIAAFVSALKGTGSKYVTNKNDRPVNMGRSVWPEILKGNVAIPHTEPADSLWRGHNLINKYLADETSKQRIINKMKSVLNAVRVDTTGLANYGEAETLFSSVSWTAAIPSLGRPARMMYQIPGDGTTLVVEDATTEMARAKADENARLCLPALIEYERLIRLGTPPAWPWQPVSGCYTQREALIQAWNIYSSTGVPESKALWENYTGRWSGFIGGTCS